MVIQENEVILFVLATGVFITIAVNRKRIATLPNYRLLVAGYAALYIGWALTILEGFAWGNLLNLLEHIAYCFSMIFMARWCLRTLRGKVAQ